MVQRTVTTLLTCATVLTRFGLVIQRVILVFLPPMTLLAVRPLGTTVIIIPYEVGGLPLGARHILIIDLLWLPAIILPIMSVNAETAVVMS